jgi:N-acyl-D-amino-acid deacylase
MAWLKPFPFFVLTLVVLSTGRAAEFDVLIRGGRVLDGSGTPWVYADVGINGDRIAAVGRLPEAKAKQVIEAAGLYVAPGFIDGHSHAGPALAGEKLADAAALLAQGITTVFVNPDGGGPTDLVLQRAMIERQRPGVNVAQLIGHNSVRIDVLGNADRAPTEAEQAQMNGIVRRAMQAGAFGLSAGPFYTPGNFSKTEEHIVLARVAAEFDGFYTSHIRDESDYNVGLVAAVDELIRVAREARLPGIVTHIKALGPRVWGLSAQVIRNIDAARAEGVEIFADQYPYEAGSTGLTAAIVPAWAREGGDGALRARLANAETRAQIRTEMLENIERRAGAAKIMISRHRADPALEGRRLDEIARAQVLEPVDAAIGIIRAGGASIVTFVMGEEDIRRFMVQPWTMTCSDGELVALGDGVPHPRVFGAFPRKLRRYVVEEKVLTLERAIHSMTGLPATVFRLPERGTLRAGAMADVVVFDLATVRDVASYEDPHHFAEGMRAILVNGRVALEGGKVTSERAGRILVKTFQVK